MDKLLWVVTFTWCQPFWFYCLTLIDFVWLWKVIGKSTSNNNNDNNNDNNNNDNNYDNDDNNNNNNNNNNLQTFAACLVFSVKLIVVFVSWWMISSKCSVLQSEYVLLLVLVDDLSSNFLTKLCCSYFCIVNRIDSSKAIVALCSTHLGFNCTSAKVANDC